MPGNSTDTLKITTQSELEAYFNETYGLAAQAYARSEAMNKALGGGTISLSEAGAAQETQKGDGYFKHENYTKAAKHYRKSLRSIAYFCEGFYKLGMCILKGADIQQAKLNQLTIYKKRDGDTLSKNELAAVFFREVMALDPSFNEATYRLKKTPFNPHFSFAIYNLAVCLSQGAPIDAQDLINTPYEGWDPKNINSKNVEMGLYERVLLINPQHPEAGHKLKTLATQALPTSWFLETATQQDVIAGLNEGVNKLTIKTENLEAQSTEHTPPLLYSPHGPFKHWCGTTSEEAVRDLRRPKLYSPPTELNLCDLVSPTSRMNPSPLSTPRKGP